MKRKSIRNRALAAVLAAAVAAGGVPADGALSVPVSVACASTDSVEESLSKSCNIRSADLSSESGKTLRCVELSEKTGPGGDGNQPESHGSGSEVNQANPFSSGSEVKQTKPFNSDENDKQSDPVGSSAENNQTDSPGSGAESNQTETAGPDDSENPAGGNGTPAEPAGSGGHEESSDANESCQTEPFPDSPPAPLESETASSELPAKLPESLLSDTLSAETGDTKISVSRLDKEPFPSGSYLLVNTPASLAAQEEAAQEALELYEEMLLAPVIHEAARQYQAAHTEITWTDTQTAYLEMSLRNAVRSLHAYEIQVCNSDGSTCETGELYCTLEICDQGLKDGIKIGESRMMTVRYDPSLAPSILESGQFDLGYKDSSNLAIFGFSYIPETFAAVLELDASWTYVPDPESEARWFEIGDREILCTCESRDADPWMHSFTCDAFLACLAEECTCQADGPELIFHEESCAAFIRTLNLRCTCGSHSPDESTHAEDCALFAYFRNAYLEQERSAAAYAFSQQGSPCKSSSGYVKVSPGDRTYSSKYTTLRSHSNTQSIPWYDSSTVTKGLKMDLEGNYTQTYLIPKSSAAAGKFGWRITNVGYSTKQNCYLDLYVTVTNFDSYALSASGVKVNGIYPYISIDDSMNIRFGTSRFPAFELKMDVVRSGTNTKVSGNYRFSWEDIDSMQRFGFALQNGTLDKKYCLKDCEVNCETKSFWGTSYHMLYGPKEDGNDEPSQSVMFETSGTSGYRIYFGQVLNGDGVSKSLHGAAELKKYYDNAADGTFDYTKGGAIRWRGFSYGPVSLPEPVTKYVSNDGKTWAKSNTLASPTSEYWYMLEFYVPEEQADYYYSQFYIQDALPDGADYIADTFSAEKMETGGNAKSSFQLSASRDTLKFDAAAAGAVSKAGFYGYTYRLKFKVKMDPSEISPTISGNTKNYQISNTAALNGKHKTDSAAVTKQSNAVTTKASETIVKNKISVLSKQVSNDAKTWSEKNTLPDVAGEYWYRLQINVPSNSPEAFFTGLKLTDKLPDGADYAGNLTVTAQNTDVTSSFTVSSQNDTVVLQAKASALNSSGFYGKTYIVRFRAKMDISETEPEKKDNRTIYTLKNSFQANVSQKTVSDYSLTSNTVITEAVSKSVTLKKISERMEGETAGGALPGVRFRIWKKETGSEKDASVFTTDQNGQITLWNYAPGVWCFKEEAPPDGYASDQTVREFTIASDGRCGKEENHEIVIENQLLKAEFLKTDKATGLAVAGARLQLTDQNGKVLDTWVSAEKPHRIERIKKGTYLLTELEAPSGYKKGKPAAVVIEDTPKLQKFSISNCRYVEIRLTKAILADEIVWAHGNPTFTFCVEGTDLDAEEHRWYETVEFEPVTTADHGTVYLTAHFRVPAGTYRAWELNVIRYRLEQISSVENGQVSGVGVNFTLTGNENGAAIFTNRKTTDEDLSETDFVRNTVAG